MIPGLSTKLSEEVLASAATIAPKRDLIILTGNTTIATITPGQFGGGFSGILCVVPKDNNVATTTTGNIAVNVTMPQNRITVLVYSKSQDKWYPGAIS